VAWRKAANNQSCGSSLGTADENSNYFEFCYAPQYDAARSLILNAAHSLV
jgi:cellobiose phosphorylase